MLELKILLQTKASNLSAKLLSINKWIGLVTQPSEKSNICDRITYVNTQLR